MLHVLPLLAALVTLQANELDIRYVGNAGVELYDGTTTLLVDLPYQSGAFGYMAYDPTQIRARGRVVAVITHRHDDHFDSRLFLSTDWTIYGPAEVTGALPADRALQGDRQTLGAFTVQRVRTPHAGTEHYSYLVTWRGRRLYFVGDTEDPTHILATRDLDVLFITPWLSCAAERAGTLHARTVVLYHHTTSGGPAPCGRPRVPLQGEVWAVSALP